MKTETQCQIPISEFTGRTNIGTLYDYALILKIKDNLISTYMAIGRRSLGYCRATTKIPKEINMSDFTVGQWANSIGIGRDKFMKNIKKLSEQNLIRVHTGSNYRQDGGSYPNYYSIVFDADTQKKHKLFFNIGGVKTKDKEEEHIEDEPENVNSTRKIENEENKRISDMLFN